VATEPVETGLRVRPAGIRPLDVDADQIDAVRHHVIKIIDMPIGDGRAVERIAAADAPQIDRLAPEERPIAADRELLRRPGGLGLCFLAVHGVRRYRTRDEGRGGAYDRADAWHHAVPCSEIPGQNGVGWRWSPGRAWARAVHRATASSSK